MAASDTVKNILCLGTEINEILETLIVRGQKSGEVRKEVVPVLTVYVLSTSIDSLLALAETKGKFILRAEWYDRRGVPRLWFPTDNQLYP